MPAIADMVSNKRTLRCKGRALLRRTGGFGRRATLKVLPYQSGVEDNIPLFIEGVILRHNSFYPSSRDWIALLQLARRSLPLTMASQTPTDNVPAGDAAPTSLPDRTQNPADGQAGESKNAAKKAEKAAKMAAAKAEKAAKHAAGVKSEKKETKKAPKKKVDGAALIGIDAAKEENFPDWYQQVLTKGKTRISLLKSRLLTISKETCWTTMMCRAASF